MTSDQKQWGVAVAGLLRKRSWLKHGDISLADAASARKRIKALLNRFRSGERTDKLYKRMMNEVGE